MLSVLAELQRELIVANTRDGLAAARARGRVGGRKPRLTPEQAALAQQLYDARDKTVAQIAALFSVPRSTVYGHLTVNPVDPAAGSTAPAPALSSRSPPTRRGGRRHGQLPRRPRPLQDPNVCDPSPPRLPGRHPSGRPAQSQTPSPSPASSPPLPRSGPQSFVDVMCSAKPGP